MKKLIVGFTGLAVAVGGILAFASTPAGAINVFDECPRGSDAAVCQSRSDDGTNLMKTVIQTLIYIIGIISVIMIVIGGLNYTTSRGDSNKIQDAKNTILYSVIGLAVAILSFGIVNFVIDLF